MSAAEASEVFRNSPEYIAMEATRDDGKSALVMVDEVVRAWSDHPQEHWWFGDFSDLRLPVPSLLLRSEPEALFGAKPESRVPLLEGLFLQIDLRRDWEPVGSDWTFFDISTEKVTTISRVELVASARWLISASVGATGGGLFSWMFFLQPDGAVATKDGTFLVGSTPTSAAKPRAMPADVSQGLLMPFLFAIDRYNNDAVIHEGRVWRMAPGKARQ